MTKISNLLLIVSLLWSFSSCFNLNKNTKYKEELTPKKENQKIIEPFSGMLSNIGNNVFNHFYLAKSINCNSNTNCPKQFGKCISPSECQCNYGHSNYFYNDNYVQNTEGFYCSYKQKEQFRAFLYEAFLLFGAGHIYSERYFVGYTKFTLCFILLALFLIQSLISKSFHLEQYVKNSPILAISFLLIITILGIWQLLDLVLFGLNLYLDGNDIPLAPWIA